MTEAELESIAQQLVARLRDDDPEAVNRWLCSQVSNPNDWYRLCFVLAAAVPDDQRWSELLAWWTGPPMEPVKTRPRAGEFIDEIAVERACYGEGVFLNAAERRAAVAKLMRRGMNQVQIGGLLGLSVRSVNRHAAALRKRSDSVAA